MNQNQRILKEYKKFLKLAHEIHPYNIRMHTLRKLRYDFQNHLNNKNTIEDLFTKFKYDYEKLNRIVLIQNINVPYEEFKYKKIENNQE